MIDDKKNDPEVSAGFRFVKAMRTSVKQKGFLRSMKNAIRLTKEGRIVDVIKSKMFSAGAANDRDYQLWRKYYQPKTADLETMREFTKKGPKISVIVPVYNTPERYLSEMIESVSSQYYQNWELILSDDGSTDSGVKSVLDKYIDEPRIKILFNEKNEGISAASNRALDLAMGEYIALLDHDDLIEPHALLRMAFEIVQNPDVDMLYSDEDKLSERGEYVDPFFKPDWSPEYFFACMYTCHLGVYRTSIVKEMGGFRSEFDFAQDYDLVLRFISKTQRIKHVSDILYHWRVIPSSTASGAQAKPTAHLAAQKAIQSNLDSRNIKAEVKDGFAAGFHRVRYEVPSERPKVSIIIPTGSKKLLIRGNEQYVLQVCLESLYSKSTYPNFEVIVLDDDDIPAELEKVVCDLGVKLLHFKKPFNFSEKINLGASHAVGEYLLLLNDDIEVISPGWIEEMLAFGALEGVGAVGSKLIFPDRRLQHVGITVLNGEPGHPYYGQPDWNPGYFNMNVCHRNVSAVTAACMLTKKDYFDQVKGFDESFPLNYNDVDYCLKLVESGKRIVYTPHAELFHFESISKSGTYKEELDHFQTKWNVKLRNDPYCNRHLVFTDKEVRINTDRNRSYLDRDAL